MTWQELSISPYTTGTLASSEFLVQMGDEGRVVQVETRVCKHGIRRPSPWVSDSMPVRDTL